MATFNDYHEHVLQVSSKMLLGWGHTGINKNPMEERERWDPTEPLPSRVIQNVNDVWGHELPVSPPAADTADVAVYQGSPPGVGEQGAWKMVQRTDVGSTFCWMATLAGGGGPGGETDPRLEDWIPARYGKLWEPLIFEDNGSGTAPGAQVPASHVSGWLFDPQSGILTFESDPTVAGLTPPFWIKGYRYIGPDLKTVIDGISAGASITVEDSVPTPFPGVNILRFGPNFTVTDLGGGRVDVTLAASTTWPWSYRQLITVPTNGAPGVPQDFTLSNPVGVSGERVFVYIEGVKALYGTGKDYLFPAPTTIRFQNVATRTVLQAGMEIEVFYS